MSTATVSCTRCKATLLGDVFNHGELRPCPNCRNPIQVDVFPSFFRPPDIGSSGEKVLFEGEASCFYHTEKKAVVPCDGCGRFLCALCDIELNDQHLCPACLESGKKKGKLKNLENKRVLYDRMALLAATIPLILVWPSLIAAPAALYVSFRYWKEPCSLVRPSKWRFVLASVLALLQIMGWTVFFVAISTR